MGGALGSLDNTDLARFEQDSDDAEVIMKQCEEMIEKIGDEDSALRFCHPVIHKPPPVDPTDLEAWKKRKADIMNCFKQFSQLCTPAPPESVDCLISRASDTLNLSSADEDDEGNAGHLYALEIPAILEVPPEVWMLGHGLQNLSLKKNTISYLDGAGLGSLVNLINLDVSENELTELPDEICNLSKLESLNISENSIKKLPENIGQLVNLKTFLAYKNQMAELPKSIGDCESLEEINVYSNRLIKLPPTVTQLKSLLDVTLGANKLKTIPNTSNWTNLGRLSLSWNTIIMLRDFRGMQSLVQLQLNRNQLSEIPDDAFEGCSFVESIDLTTNHLTSLPTSLTACVNLKWLNVSNNKLTSLVPMETFQEIDTLNLSNNNLTTLDGYGIESCSTLAVLFVNMNKLTSIPDIFASTLSNLKRCNISANEDLDDTSSTVNALKKLCQDNEGKWID